MTAASLNVTYHFLFSPTLPWSVAPMFFYTFGMSMVAPGATLMMLDLFPEIRGVAASCQSFTLTMLGALVAGIIAPILSHSVLWLAAGQLCFTSIAMICWFFGRAYRASLRNK
jgi:DHA1 family bicyclomycin/chloramphenicol resistance-like MFS transporter